ncbi:Gfo/Idh/MocA family protein [Shouchella shacheensis]|uniref:Gfo/Idh/MocA family protein n=1 Tax=Shouchella shacheensis TaxID=1649580 RepID=UPI00073FEAB8|nr:Gfo/Idh/MocA family oxidoreductase [Shouchella shacheensis]
MLKVAVVGVNNIGSIHCNFYYDHPDTKLVAVCDLINERAQQAGQAFQISFYTDVSEMIKKEEIDVISVATAGIENGSHHYEPTMAAIQAGIDVLVEKPLSNDIQQAREMVKEAQEYNVRFACNLNHSFVPAAIKSKQLIRDGKLGSLLFINMKLTIENPKDHTSWFHLKALHPHSIDVMRHLAGDVKRVQSFMTKAPNRKGWSTVSINMEFASGAVGHLTGSYDMSRRHPIEYCEVGGDKGRIIIDNVYEHFSYYPHEKDEITGLRNSIMTGVKNFHDTFTYRLNRFIQQVRNKVQPRDIEASGTDGLAAQEVIEAAIVSHQNNGEFVEVHPLVSS